MMISSESKHLKVSNPVCLMEKIVWDSISQLEPEKISILNKTKNAPASLTSILQSTDQLDVFKLLTSESISENLLVLC